MISLSPDKLLIGWGEFQRVATKEIDLCKPAFYFPDFFLTTSQPWIQYAQWMEIAREDFFQQLQSIVRLSSCDWYVIHLEQFRQAFDDLKQLLQIDQLQKGVPYLFSHTSHVMNKERLQSCLVHGLAALKHQTGHLYGHWHSSYGVLGLTPELLFSHTEDQPRKVITMALAGTSRTSSDQEAFLKNEKEQREHQLVVQGICQSLQHFGKIQVGEIQLLHLPQLTHLLTPIEIKLNQSFNFDTLVSSLHPTPALGAFPLQEGRRWLKNFEEHTPRHYYGAPIGLQYFQKGLSQCVVGIRNVQWNALGMRIGAGCGVVKQSIFDKEWQEIQLKIQSVKSQFGL